MPAYEMTFILKAAGKPALLDTLMRHTGYLLREGAVITRATSLGHKDLPYKISQNSVHYQTANYFVLSGQLPVEKMMAAHREIAKDPELLRFFFTSLSAQHAVPKQCGLGDELLPAAYRPSVQALRDSAKQSFVTRLNAYKNAEKAWRMRAKSFTIDRRRR